MIRCRPDVIISTWNHTDSGFFWVVGSHNGTLHFKMVLRRTRRWQWWNIDNALKEQRRLILLVFWKQTSIFQQSGLRLLTRVMLMISCLYLYLMMHRVSKVLAGSWLSQNIFDTLWPDTEYRKSAAWLQMTCSQLAPGHQQLSFCVHFG